MPSWVDILVGTPVRQRRGPPDKVNNFASLMQMNTWTAYPQPAPQLLSKVALFIAKDGIGYEV